MPIMPCRECRSPVLSTDRRCQECGCINPASQQPPQQLPQQTANQGNQGLTCGTCGCGMVAALVLLAIEGVEGMVITFVLAFVIALVVYLMRQGEQ